VADLIAQLEEEMRAAAAELRYEEAALLRDELFELRLTAAAGAVAAAPGGLGAAPGDEVDGGVPDAPAPPGGDRSETALR
jgi:hypothetical protein